MTPHPEAVEERRAEIARLAEAWVRAEGEYQADDASDTERCAKLCLDSIEAEAAFTAELSRLQAALAAREEEVQWLRAALRFYADPFGKCEQVPDFYGELAFGDLAQTALAARPTPADSGEGK
jgi:ABC-type nitrate/sulfonate/bicarbonate transport system substrate-binding protein